jgi:HK97 family phage prohead protease
MNIEHRSMELRTAGDEFALVGRAIAYNKRSQDLGGFVEIIAPGAFADSVSSGDIKAYWSHQPSQILGRVRNGTLSLTDTAQGLQYKIQLNKDVRAHQDFYALVKAGTITECSFGFTVDEQTWDKSQTPTLRTVTKGILAEISLVSEPAYAGVTSAEARSRFAIPGSNLDFAIKTMRRAAQLAVTELRKAAQRGEMSQEDFASIGGHMQVAHELCEAACAVSGTVRDLMEDSDAIESLADDSDDFRSMKAAHAVSHAALEGAAERCAECRLKHGAVKTKARKK